MATTTTTLTGGGAGGGGRWSETLMSLEEIENKNGARPTRTSSGVPIEAEGQQRLSELERVASLLNQVKDEISECRTVEELLKKRANTGKLLSVVLHNPMIFSCVSCLKPLIECLIVMLSASRVTNSNNKSEQQQQSTSSLLSKAEQFALTGIMKTFSEERFTLVTQQLPHQQQSDRITKSNKGDVRLASLLGFSQAEVSSSLHTRLMKSLMLKLRSISETSNNDNQEMRLSIITSQSIMEEMELLLSNLSSLCRDSQQDRLTRHFVEELLRLYLEAPPSKSESLIPQCYVDAICENGHLYGTKNETNNVIPITVWRRDWNRFEELLMGLVRSVRGSPLMGRFQFNELPAVITLFSGFEAEPLLEVECNHLLHDALATHGCSSSLSSSIVADSLKTVMNYFAMRGHYRRRAQPSLSQQVQTCNHYGTINSGYEALLEQQSSLPLLKEIVQMLRNWKSRNQETFRHMADRLWESYTHHLRFGLLILFTLDKSSDERESTAGLIGIALLHRHSHPPYEDEKEKRWIRWLMEMTGPDSKLRSSLQSRVDRELESCVKTTSETLSVSATHARGLVRTLLQVYIITMCKPLSPSAIRQAATTLTSYEGETTTVRVGDLFDQSLELLDDCVTVIAESSLPRSISLKRLSEAYQSIHTILKELEGGDRSAPNSAMTIAERFRSWQSAASFDKTATV